MFYDRTEVAIKRITNELNKEIKIINFSVRQEKQYKYYWH